MFVSLPSYPPRGQIRETAQGRAPHEHLSVSHHTSSSSSRDTNRSLRNAQGPPPTPTTSPLGSLSRDAHISTLYTAHSQEQLFQMLEVADIDADAIMDAVDNADLESLGSWRLATACVAAALPLPGRGEGTLDAAMVDDNRALSPTVLDNIAETGTGNHTTSCESLLETFGSRGSLMSLDSFRRPSTELMDLTPWEFATLTAELAPTPLQSLASCGSDLARAVIDALMEVPASAAQLTSHPIQLFDDGSVPACSALVHPEEASSAWADADRSSDVPGAGLLSSDSSLPDLQDSPPHLSSEGWSGDSYAALTAASSDLSDAKSAPLQPQQLSQQQSHATPLSHAAGPAAVPNLAMSQQGATLAQAACLSSSAGPGLAANASGRSHRRGSTGRAARRDSRTRAQHNQHQKQYDERKRAKVAVTHSLAENLQRHVESLAADIQALCARQNKLLGAQARSKAANHVSMRNLISVIGSSGMYANPSTMADDQTAYWTQVAAGLDFTATQKRALVQLMKDMFSELKALSDDLHLLDKQLAQALKAANPTAIAGSTLRIQCNHEVAQGLHQRFSSACYEVLTQGQRAQLPGGAGTIPQPAQMQAICRAFT